MRNLIVMSTLVLSVAIAWPSAVKATTRPEALAMPLGTWPTKLACVRDANGKLNGMREEQIGITDSPQTGNVLTRSFPDSSCSG